MDSGFLCVNKSVHAVGVTGVHNLARVLGEVAQV
jgi:hypothetical protein